jgi:[ribosomal protein S18]-alanine N-acetyltransferase
VEFTLSNFRREDFEILWHIDQQCFPEGIAYSRRELSAYMKHPGSFTLVAESTEAQRESPLGGAGGMNSARGIVGFLVAAASRRGVGHIVTIDVLTEARRFGIGSRLLAAAEDGLRTAGCRSVYLETAVDNQAALAFYKRQHYFLVRTVPRYYANGVDALVLEKDLLSAARAG